MCLRSHCDDGGRLHLLSHLEAVEDISTSFFEADEMMESDDSVPLRETMSLIAYVHDIGKGTIQYQEKFYNNHDMFRHHAPIGAMSAYYIALQCGYSDEIAGICAMVVGKHHGTITDPKEYVNSMRNGELFSDHVISQAKELKTGEAATVFDGDKNSVKTELEQIINLASNDRITLDDLCDAIINNNINQAGQPTFCWLNTIEYTDILRLWSALTCADKIDASGIKNRLDNGTQFNPQTIEEKTQTYEDTSLNKHRNKARNSALKNITNIKQGEICRLTLPTGMGKTYTGIQSALQLYTHINASRVIYALPYTSIIDQTLDEIHNLWDVDTTGPNITVDHYLSDTVVTETTKTNYNRNDTLAGRLWRTPFTLTTFVQLFESIIGPQNKQSLKLPALQNSIIILDEPQAIPPSKWDVIASACEILTQKYNATIIFMTATQPSIFSATGRQPPQKELINNPKQYYELFDRVQFKLDETIHHTIKNNTTKQHSNNQEEKYKDYTEAANELITTAKNNNQIGVICNTISSTNHLYDVIADTTNTTSVNEEYIKNYHPKDLTQKDIQKIAKDITQQTTQEKSIATINLTTRHTPQIRLTLIKLITALREHNCPLICTTTQLIEAGVDISFTHIYRDYAPIDSIVQAAGRCNRNDEKDTGIVTIWQLAAPPNTNNPPSKQIYNTEHLSKTTTSIAHTLNKTNNPKTPTIPEKTLTYYGPKTYFTNIKNTVEKTNTNNIKTLKHWSLIDEDPNTTKADIIITNTKKQHKNITTTTTPPHKILDNHQQQTISTHLNTSIKNNKNITPIDKQHNIYTTQLNNKEYDHNKGLIP